jgi:hypothetical protein
MTNIVQSRPCQINPFNHLKTPMPNQLRTLHAAGRGSAARLLLFVAMLFTALAGCSRKQDPAATTDPRSPRKTAVLLVSHGSPSESWRNALFDLEQRVAPAMLTSGSVTAVRTAFMEYTEPSIATRLKEFDREGFTDVVVVPLFLTVSPHSFDDLPTIMGQKEDPRSMETLKLEKIERYKPQAAIRMTPLLDFGDALRQNVVRRARALSKHPADEGIVLIGYGDEEYEKEWNELFVKVGQAVRQETGIDALTHGWCGHIARYRPDSTTAAINRILKRKKRALVIPVLVAFDENFQVRIIGGGIEKADGGKERVSYKPDALLPDPAIEQWIVKAVKTEIETLNAKTRP